MRSEEYIIEKEFIHNLFNQLGDNLRGAILYGSRTGSLEKNRFSDIDLVIVCKSVYLDALSKASNILNQICAEESILSNSLVHPPIFLSSNDLHLLNSFYAKLILTSGIIVFQNDDLKDFFIELKNLSSDNDAHNAARTVASNSLLSMQLFALPHGKFLENDRLARYFTHHFFRWLQTTVWILKNHLCATKEQSLSNLKFIIPSPSIEIKSVNQTYEIFSDEKNRQQIYLDCLQNHLI